MILFHGSDKEVAKPLYGYGRSDCDYGSGFYLCPNKDAASIWASSNIEGGYINEYSLDINDLKILYLNNNTPTDILRWITLLCVNRIDQETRLNNLNKIEALIQNFSIDLSDIDLIVGYRADDSFFDYARSFLNDDLPLELLKEAMDLGHLGLQYVLISKKAFDTIKFKNSYQVVNSNELKELEELANHQYNELLSKRQINHIYLRDILREIDKYR